MSVVLRTVGYVFGLVAGLLIVIESLLTLFSSAGSLLAGRSAGTAASLTLAFILFVVGILILVLVRRGRHFWTPRRTVVSGVLLVVLALVVFLLVGLGGSLILLVGAVLALLAGILYLTGLGSRLFRLFAGV